MDTTLILECLWHAVDYHKIAIYEEDLIKLLELLTNETDIKIITTENFLFINFDGYYAVDDLLINGTNIEDDKYTSLREFLTKHYIDYGFIKRDT